jgi:hypothetical protein
MSQFVEQVTRKIRYLWAVLQVLCRALEQTATSSFEPLFIKEEREQKFMLMSRNLY